MPHIVIRQKPSYTPAFGLSLLIGATALSILAKPQVNHNDFTLLVACSLIVILALWSTAIKRRRTVEIDCNVGTVLVRSVSVLFRPRSTTYQLSEFKSVISYVTLGRFPENRVELITVTGGQALLLAAFPPSSKAASFFSIPTDSEAQSATQLRGRIVQACRVKDTGFLGHRMRGNQL